MTTTQWLITLAVTLVAGGAMGSVIGIFATNRRNRIQPIGAKREIIPFVNRQVAGSASNAEVSIKIDGKEESYRNLTLGRVTLTNTANKDYEEFRFEITLSGLNMATYIQTESPDRSHVITTNPSLNLNSLDNEIDVALTPFNRGDTYNICMFIIPTTEPIEIGLSSKHPVRFVELQEYRDVATSILWDVMENVHVIGVPVGLPIRSFRKRLNK
jgi:hypothetical protein